MRPVCNVHFSCSSGTPFLKGPGANMTPTWSQLGPNFGPTWALLGESWDPRAREDQTGLIQIQFFLIFHKFFDHYLQKTI